MSMPGMRIRAALAALLLLCTTMVLTSPTASAAPACGVLADGAADQANAAVLHACDQIGLDYSWGGGHVPGQPGPSFGICDPQNGAPNDCRVKGLDCSGLVRFAYFLSVGEDIIDGTSGSQFQTSRAVDRFAPAEGLDPLLPGDLMFFRNSKGNISHVSIYAGDGWMVEAPSSGLKVRMASATRSGYAGAVRLFEAGTSGQPAPGVNRIAYTDGTDLWAKDGPLDAEPILQEGDVKKFQLAGERIGVL
ncbi:hypothetical protein ALI144C_00015, partial [Actinosynnema sp. ALI-1.44]